MADAPEVVPQPQEVVPSSPPPISPESIGAQTGEETATTTSMTAASPKHDEPAEKEFWDPESQAPAWKPDKKEDPESQAPTWKPDKKEDHEDKEAGSGLEKLGIEEKEVRSPESEETSPKHAVAGQEGDREAEGLQAVPREDEGMIVAPPTGQKAIYLNRDDEDGTQKKAVVRARKEENEWMVDFWDCFSSSGLCIESLFCPCILTGRTHAHLHDPENPHPSSTNTYCTSCCLLNFFLIVGAPMYCFFTVSQRREVRYRYHIKGSNCEDCWKGTFCVWCSFVQEEKEVVKRMQLEKDGQREEVKGLEKRGEKMVYEPPGR